MKKINKLFLAAGSIAAVAAPIAAVVSCGSSEEGIIAKSTKTAGYPASLNALALGGNDAITVAGAWGDARYNITDASLRDHVKVVGVEKERINNDGIQARANMKPSDVKALQDIFVQLIKDSNKGEAGLAVPKMASDKTSVAFDETKVTAATIDAAKTELKALNTATKTVFSEADLKKIDSLKLKDGAQESATTVKEAIKALGLVDLTKYEALSDKEPLFQVYSHTGYIPVKSGQKIGAMSAGEPQICDTNVNSATTFNPADSDFFVNEATAGAGVAGLQSKPNTKVRIIFIPSNDAARVTLATKALVNYLKTKGIEADINVAADYNVAATQLHNKQVELAFLPVDTWYEYASDSQFIIQAARPAQVSIMDVSGTEAKMPGATIDDEKMATELMNKYGQLFLSEVKTGNPLSNSKAPANALANFKVEAAKAGTPESKILAFVNAHDDLDDQQFYGVGAYEAWLYAKDDSAFYSKVTEAEKAQGNGWNIDFATVNADVNYGFTSTTSSSSYIYPELWFRDHFNGFGSFN